MENVVCPLHGSVNERRVAGAQPCFHIAPELPGKRQNLGNLRLRHGGRGVIRNAVALAPEPVEFPHQRRVGPEAVFYRLDRDRVVTGRIGVGAITRGVQGRGRHGEGRVVRELEAPFGAQAADAGVSEASVGQREETGDFLSCGLVHSQRALVEPGFQAHLPLRSGTIWLPSARWSESGCPRAP